MIGKTPYLDIFQAMPTPCVLLFPNKPSFTICGANDTYLKLTNTTREKLIGENFFDVFTHNPYYTDIEWLGIFDNVLLKKKTEELPPQKYVSLQVEKEISNQTKYVKVTNTPILDDCGEITMIIHSLVDATDAIRHERFLDETQQVAKMGSWEYNLIEQTITWSPALRLIFELPPNCEPNFNQSLSFFADDVSRDIVSKEIQRVKKDGTVFRQTLPIITAKGKKRWIFTMGKADLVDGKCMRLYGISQDVTEQKETENALRSSEYNYINLLQTVDGIVWEADSETLQASFVSPKVEEILGYTAEDWLTDPGFWPNHIYEGDREHAINFCLQQTKKLANHTFDYRMVKKDGEIIWVKDVVSVIAKDGKPCLLRGIIVDITETKKAELELQKLHEQLELRLIQVEESEHKYSELFHFNPLPMWVYDLETFRYLDVNAAAVAHYGYTREEFLSMTIMDIRPPEEKSKLSGGVLHSSKNKALFSQGISKHCKKNGEIVDVETRRNVIKFQGRNAEVVLAHDITERLSHVNAIEKQNKKLQEIAWMQSHLVRAPLARIMGLIDIIQNIPHSDIDDSELLKQITNSAIELDGILMNITAKAALTDLAKK